MQQRQKHKGGFWAEVAILGKQHGDHTEQKNVCLGISMQCAFRAGCAKQQTAFNLTAVKLA